MKELTTLVSDINKELLSKSEEIAFKRLLSYFNKYVLQSNRPFTCDILSGELSTETFEKINTRYLRYLSDTDTFYKPLINNLLQKRALNPNARENTKILKEIIDIDETTYYKICAEAEKLRLVCDNSKHTKDKNFDCFLIPGALQIGVEKRIDTLLNYIQQHPHFNGFIFVFGSSDRKLLPFTTKGNIKEGLTFDLIAQKLNKESQDIKKLLQEEFNKLSNTNKKNETIIANLLSKWLEKTYHQIWPTEYDMAKHIANEKLGKYKNVKVIQTYKKQNDSQNKQRATSADEALFIADIIKNTPSIHKIAVITNFRYQVETYQSKLRKIGKKIDMLSPFPDINSYIEYSLKPRLNTDGVDTNDIQLLRTHVLLHLFDTLARWYYSLLSYHVECIPVICANNITQ